MATYDDVKTKLDYLDGTKQLIKQAIIAKGQNIEDMDTFREYVDKINEIPLGDFLNAMSTYTYTDTVNVDDVIYIPVTDIEGLKIGSICLIRYAPNNGSDDGFEGIMLVRVEQISSTEYTLDVLYKDASNNDYIKIFKTIEDMNNDETAYLGELAVVYGEINEMIESTTEFQYIIFPESVTLSDAIIENYLCTFNMVDESDGDVNVQVELTNTMFEFTGNIVTSDGLEKLGSIVYTSSDGIHYTRTQMSADSQNIHNPVNIGKKIVADSETWNSSMGYFMYNGDMEFGGLFEYVRDTDTQSNKYEIARNQYSLENSDQLEENVSAYGRTGNILGTLIRTLTPEEYAQALALAKDIQGIN